MAPDRVVGMSGGGFLHPGGPGWSVENRSSYTTGCCGTNTNWSYIVMGIDPL